MKFKRSIIQKISCARSLGVDSWSLTKNKHQFGIFHAPNGLGANLQVSVTFESNAPSPNTEKEIKAIIKEWDHFRLNDLPDFKSVLPTALNMSAILFSKIKLIEPLLTQIEVRESPWFWASTTQTGSFVTTRVRIQCIHRHHNESLNDNENRELYGQCSQRHGHEYNIEFSFLVNSNIEENFFSPGLGEVESILKTHIVEKYHGQYLNDHIGNTSGEIICEHFYSIVKPLLPTLIAVRLRETFKNSFIVEESGFSQ